MFQDLVHQAEAALAPVIRETPCEYSEPLSDHLGVPVHLKLECLQITGSFKIRGAWFALSRLKEAGQTRVATVSAGNHGIGVAWAGRMLGLEVRIYVPRSVDAAKAAHLESLGAELVRSEFDGFDDTELWALGQIEAARIPFLSAYDDERILAANGGTLMLEIRRQVPDVETVVVPVGGGGMSGGMVSCDEAPARLVAAQTAASPALRRSLKLGSAVTRLETGDTLAGGLEGGIGQTGFAALRDRVKQVIEVSEPAIAMGMRWMLEHHHYVIEPSSAVAVAACLDPAVQVSGPTVVVLSGRNVALDTVRAVVA
ncbi:MAG: pyridoxal-phosphate dependent enzyme [Rhodothermales bacterium]|nr:pyridoxal-phosphate dependent enzyme [Rhodothermales bacterium]MBO6780947.1 pyridoxal-phosphate dependent enzyme [Rhodothermales bacterium]